MQEIIFLVRKFPFAAFVDEDGIPKVFDALGHGKFERLRCQPIQWILPPEESQHFTGMVILDIAEGVTADTDLANGG